MIENENEAIMRAAGGDEDGSKRRGVVICLEAHRRWRSHTDPWSAGSLQTDDAFKWADTLPPDDDVTDEPVVAVAREPSLWLAVLAGVITVASLVGAYWAFTVAMPAILSLSLMRF